MKKQTPIVISIPFDTELASTLLKHPGREITLHIADRSGARSGHIAGPWAVWKRSNPPSTFATSEAFEPHPDPLAWCPPNDTAPHSSESMPREIPLAGYQSFKDQVADSALLDSPQTDAPGPITDTLFYYVVSVFMFLAGVMTAILLPKLFNLFIN